MTMESDPSIDEISIHMAGPPVVFHGDLQAILEGEEDSEEET
jgi:hypothetical protein